MGDSFGIIGPMIPADLPFTGQQNGTGVGNENKNIWGRGYAPSNGNCCIRFCCVSGVSCVTCPDDVAAILNDCCDAAALG